MRGFLKIVTFFALLALVTSVSPKVVLSAIFFGLYAAAQFKFLGAIGFDRHVSRAAKELASCGKLPAK